jgi:hypothetical protein
MTNDEHVPEMGADPKPNRAQRRHPERTADRPIARDVQEDIRKVDSDDDVSVRAKSSGHKKKTADKWNQ